MEMQRITEYFHVILIITKKRSFTELVHKLCTKSDKTYTCRYNISHQREKKTIGLCLTCMFTSSSIQVMQVPQRCPTEENWEIVRARFCYKPDALPVTKPTVSKH